MVKWLNQVTAGIALRRLSGVVTVLLENEVHLKL